MSRMKYETLTLYIKSLIVASIARDKKHEGLKIVLEGLTLSDVTSCHCKRVQLVANDFNPPRDFVSTTCAVVSFVVVNCVAQRRERFKFESNILSSPNDTLQMSLLGSHLFDGQIEMFDGVN